MAVVSREIHWEHPPAHWHRKIITASEMVGVSKVFPGLPLQFYLKIHVSLAALEVAALNDLNIPLRSLFYEAKANLKKNYNKNYFTSNF